MSQYVPIHFVPLVVLITLHDFSDIKERAGPDARIAAMTRSFFIVSPTVRIAPDSPQKGLGGWNCYHSVLNDETLP